MMLMKKVSNVTDTKVHNLSCEVFACEESVSPQTWGPMGARQAPLGPQSFLSRDGIIAFALVVRKDFAEMKSIQSLCAHRQADKLDQESSTIDNFVSSRKDLPRNKNGVAE